ncbi:MAG: metallophosphoesterase, partial [Bacteroidota bacterium]
MIPALLANGKRASDQYSLLLPTDMRIVCISDTHGFHHHLQLPQGDILIHAGDFSKQGKPEEIHAFLTWFDEQAFEYKIFIAGNHDFLAETDPTRFREMIPSGLIYLENNGIELEGHYFWGSP